MTRRNLKDKNVRKIFASGSSAALTLPKEIMDELKWRKGQKLVVKRRGEKIIIEDWK